MDKKKTLGKNLVSGTKSLSDFLILHPCKIALFTDTSPVHNITQVFGSLHVKSKSGRNILFIKKNKQKSRFFSTLVVSLLNKYPKQE